VARVPVVVLLGAVLILTPVLGSSAQAAETVYGKIGEFGEAGSGNGEFNKPEGIAVDPRTGDIFVADTENHRVDVFQPTATGATYLIEFGEGELSKPVSIAVDPTTGAVYVCDAGLNQIVKYDQTAGSPPAFARDPEFVSPPDGTATGEIGSFGETQFYGAVFGGIAVDPTVDTSTGTHDILLADPANKLIERFTSNGAFVKSFNGLHFGTPFVAVFTEPTDLAINAAGDVLVTDVNPSEETSRTLLYNGEGEYLATLGPVPNASPTLTGAALGIETATGQAFVASKYPEIPSPGDIYRFNGPTATPPNSEIDHVEVGNLGVFSGIALRPASGSIHSRLYAMAGMESLVASRKVLVFEALTPPEVAIAATTAITATTATFHGTVNPVGTDAKWHFEYRPVGGSAWASTPIPDGDAGAGEARVEVEASAQSLEPHIEYEARLHATNNSGATSQISATVTFTTKATPPIVKTEAAVSLSDTSATLVGTVSPRNSEVVDCHFEWGATASYGHTAPCATMPGSGGAAVYVTGALSGLSPTSSYHFRLVAADKCAEGCGTSEGEDSAFTTRSATEVVIPVRGYELVSTASTNGLEAEPDIASPDGEHFAYWTFLPSPGAEDGGLFHFFRASRNSDGSWSQVPVGADASTPTGRVSTTVQPFFSADLSSTAFGLQEWGSLNPDDQNNASDLYLYNTSTNDFTWVSRDPEIPVGTPQTDPASVSLVVSYLSPNGERLLFQAERRLLPAAVEGVTSLYEWDEGRLSLVALPPGSSSGFTGESALGSAGSFSQRSREVAADAASRDGSRVVFEAREGSALPPQLYVRLDGERTLDVSAPAPGVVATSAPYNVEYWGADAEDNTVFFTSSSPLAADSTAPATNASGGCSGNVCDLYAYDVASESLRDLTPYAGGGGVERVWDVSEDGGRIYFTSSKRLNQSGALTETAQTGESLEGVAGGPNLYLAELEGSEVKVTFIATVEGGEPTPAGHESERFRETAADASGSLLAFRSRASLVHGRSTGGFPQIFVYDAERRELSCASCLPDGLAATAQANLSPSTPTSAGNLTLASSEGIENVHASRARNISPDGAVFFQTGSALVPGDTNGAIDVYEWRGGQVALISSGTGAENAMFGDATAGPSTASGATVFFRSGASLVPGAQAGVQHIYAARVGGGYYPPTPAPACSGGDCQGPLGASPIFGAPASSTFSGLGNVPTPPAVKSKPKDKLLTRAQKLADALKACKKKPKENRRLCVSRAKRRYGKHARTSSRGSVRHNRIGAR
jgi:DNA-binding beta-propeller fold protein YncE